MRLEEYPLIVLVFHQEGCPSCAEYLPRVRAIAEQWAACVPTAMLDTGKHSLLADGAGVRYTPTTVIARHGRISMHPSHRLEGAAADEAIVGLYSGCAGVCDLETAA